MPHELRSQCFSQHQSGQLVFLISNLIPRIPRMARQLTMSLSSDGNRSSRFFSVFSRKLDLMFLKCLTCCPVTLMLLPWKVISQLTRSASGDNRDVISVRCFPSSVFMAVICDTAEETAGCTTDKSK